MRAIIFLCFLVPSFSQAADFCAKYKKPVRIGALDPAYIPESSGLAISRAYPDRLYHHNDSGDDANFYLTDFSGANTQKVEVSGHKAVDMEDMAIGACGSGQDCLFLADIGDNRMKRPFITLVLVQEQEKFPNTVKPYKKIRLQYPDRAHNAESLFVHPNGDIFILTKEFHQENLQVQAAQFFKLSATEIAAAKTDSTLMLQNIGEIDIPYLNKNLTEFGQILTAADISSDGSKILTLTYENAIEFNLDLNKKFIPTKEMQNGRDFSIINFPHLGKQEAIAYLPDNKSFLYTSEGDPKHPDPPAPIMKLECEVL